MLNKLENLGDREKTGLLLAVVFLVVVAADCLVIRPALADMRQIRRDIKIKREELRHNRLVLARTEEVEQKYEEKIAKINAAASPSEVMDKLNLDVARMAERAGLELGSSNARDPQKRTFNIVGYSEYAVGIENYESEPEALLKFLHEIWISSDLLRVTKLQATSIKDGAAMKGSMLITKVTLPHQE